MRKSTILLHILNNKLGRCKYLNKELVSGLTDYLREFTYVKENDFTDDELKWHIDKFLELKLLK